MGNTADKENNNRQGDGEDQKNGLEWTVFVISLLLVLGTLAFWIHEALTDTTAPPEIVVGTKPAPSKYNPYRYHVEIYNNGGQTAESVQVEVKMYDDGKEIAKAPLDVAFVPNESLREGWVVFDKDPALADSVVARVVSFKKP